MNKQWETDNCAEMRAHYTVYSIPQAAALWCGIPENEVPDILNEAQQISQTGIGRSIWRHPSVGCLEPRSRAIAEAIESGDIPHGREDGRPVAPGEHVAHERRHFFGRDLRNWIKEAFPLEKPEFLFYEIERNTTSDLTIDSYNSLKAENEMLARRIEKAEEAFKSLRSEKEELEKEVESLRSQFEGNEPPETRAEVAYQIIIGALVETILGDGPKTKKRLELKNQTALINFLIEEYPKKFGISQRNLEKKFPLARTVLMQST
ncbi:hypothetical protein D893_02695 [Thioalkalivibrio sp. ALE21]|uniref:hypothetical protein n=1 Tax=Thioalkalivibrio sp. ALE21 TaxID=1158175 RepID=UPI000D9C8B8A|nr:hypothetical protein [Thioalkalivibrio sp. ALE21]PYF99289.1 hypothetical protein D893_02695 [Thioalkalivibrio sp. ALE21]